MKKFLIFLLIMCIPFSVLAEGYKTVVDTVQMGTLTIENCDDLATLLQLKDEFDDRIKAFAADYAGQTIEFDGNIAAISPHERYKTRYDLLIYAGDYSEASVSGPNFQFSNVGVFDLGLSDLHLPEFIRVGSNIHVFAVVKEYKKVSGLFILDPVLITPREETASEALDTSAYVSLKKGSKGNEVKALQQRLIDLFYLTGKVDGSFGKKTSAAVEKFQAKNALDVTGIADPLTQALLFSEQAIENTLSVSRSSIVIGSSATTTWYVDGQEFTLKNKKTKTVKTAWSTYKFNSFGNYEKVD